MIEKGEDAGISEEEIEVTPEMIDEGISQLAKFDPEWGLSHEDAVIAIFRAMERCRAKRLPT